MDGYKPAFVAHNVPYLVVSGLGGARRNHADLKAEEGVHIASDVPPVESEDAEVLLKHFNDSDAEGLAWNSREHSGRNKFRVRIVGRVVPQTQ
jgi:trafficking protein particle complex subunit 11